MDAASRPALAVLAVGTSGSTCKYLRKTVTCRSVSVLNGAVKRPGACGTQPFACACAKSTGLDVWMCSSWRPAIRLGRGQPTTRGQPTASLDSRPRVAFSCEGGETYAKACAWGHGVAHRCSSEHGRLDPSTRRLARALVGARRQRASMKVCRATWRPTAGKKGVHVCWAIEVGQLDV